MTQKSANIYARIEPDIKKQAEDILSSLGVSASSAINMFYISPKYWMQQIVFREMIPVLGNNGTILLYICMTLAGAALIHLVWNYIDRKKR